MSHFSSKTGGKTADTANLQDLLVYYAMGISQYAHRAQELGASRDKAVDTFLLDSLFSTMTNVNFDPTRFVQYLNDAEKIRGETPVCLFVFVGFFNDYYYYYYYMVFVIDGYVSEPFLLRFRSHFQMFC